MSLQQKTAALPPACFEPPSAPEAEGGGGDDGLRAEGSFFLRSSLPPSLTAIANQSYKRTGAPLSKAPLLKFRSAEAPEQQQSPRTALVGYEATLARAAELVASNATQQARLAQGRQVSLAAATERGEAAAALIFERDVVHELASASLKLERSLEEERRMNEITVLFWGVGALGLRFQRQRTTLKQPKEDEPTAAAAAAAESAVGGAGDGGGGSGLDDSNSSAGSFSFGATELDRTHERLVLQVISDPNAPQKYEESAAWLRMVGMQAQNDAAGSGTVGVGTVAAFRSMPASGFSASFYPSPAYDAFTAGTAAGGGRSPLLSDRCVFLYK